MSNASALVLLALLVNSEPYDMVQQSLVCAALLQTHTQMVKSSATQLVLHNSELLYDGVLRMLPPDNSAQLFVVKAVMVSQLRATVQAGENSAAQDIASVSAACVTAASQLVGYTHE